MKCATMGSKGLHNKEQSRVDEVTQINEDLTTDCPDSDSDNNMATPCISDTEDDEMVDLEYKFMNIQVNLEEKLIGKYLV